MQKYNFKGFLIIEIILLYVLLVGRELDILILVLAFQLQIIIMNKIGIVKNKLIRRISYFIVYIVCIIWVYSRFEIYGRKNSITLYLVSILVALLLFIPDIKNFKLYMDKEFAKFLGPISKKDVRYEIFSSIVSAILQELFYKLCVYNIFSIYINRYIAAVFTALLFSLEHSQHWAADKEYTWKDYFRQFLMSFYGGIIYIVTGSVWYGVLVHCLYNVPFLITNIFRYYINKEYKISS